MIAVATAACATAALFLPSRLEVLSVLFVFASFLCAAPLIRTGFTHPLHGTRGFRVIASAAIIVTGAAAVMGAFALPVVGEAMLVLGMTIATAAMLVVDHRLAQAPPIEDDEHELIELPVSVERIERGVKKQVPRSELKTGNSIYLEHGMTIPADGILLDGELTVDEFAVTHMHGTTKKLSSNAVYAGSLVLAGRALCTVRVTGDETVYARIRHEQDAPQHGHHDVGLHLTERLVVLTGSTSAILATGIWALAEGTNATALVTYGLAAGGSVLLVTAALVAALRLAKRPDSGHALTRAGIRLKEPDALARLRDADTIVFEKTGVLTTGSFAVEHVISFKPYTQQQVLNTAAAVEAAEDHSIASTIVAFARAHGALALQRADDIRHDADGGVSALVNGKRVSVGSVAYLQRRKVRIPKEISEHAAAGNTVILVGAENDCLGSIVLSDTPREETREVIAALKKRYRIVLLSGDHEDAAVALSTSLGMHEVIADANGTRKKAALQAMRDAGKKVVLVSDDVRDAPVSLRVVLTSEGKTIAALEQADITILGSDLRKFADAVEVAHSAEKAEMHASAWVTATAVVLVPLAAVSGSVPISAIGAALVVIGSLRASEKNA